MANDAIMGAIGLAQKAGRCVSGTDTVKRAMSADAAKLLLIDEEMSPRTRDDWLRACDGRGLPVLTVANLGASIGKPGRMVVAVTDEAFVKMIIASRDLRESAEKHGGNE